MDSVTKGKISVQEYENGVEIEMCVGSHINITFVDGELLIGIPSHGGYNVASRIIIPKECETASFQILMKETKESNI